MERSNLMERKSQGYITMLQVFCDALKMVFFIKDLKGRKKQ